MSIKQKTVIVNLIIVLGEVERMADTFKSDEEYIFKAEFDEDYGLRFMPTGGSIVRCKDCVYYIPEVDEPHKPTCQRLWGGMTECNADSYCSDGVRKDEVEE